MDAVTYSPPYLCQDGGLRAISETDGGELVALKRLAVALRYGGALMYLIEKVGDISYDLPVGFRWANLDDLAESTKVPRTESTDGDIAYYWLTATELAKEADRA